MAKTSKKQKDIYMDYASSVEPNSSSIHHAGVKIKENLENARKKVAEVLSARPAEIIFTSGGTESNNIAIQGICGSPASAVRKPGFRKPHIITTNIEHPSVLETCKMLETRKLISLSIVPVESNGIVDPKKIKKSLRSDTILVSVMYANNEIGTVQPIREIAKVIRHWNKNQKNKIFFHADAVQGANYLDLNVEKLGVDILTLSGSKIEGGSKAGILYVKKNTPLSSVMYGGDQERGLRPGTEDVPAILKLANALELTQNIQEKESARLTKLRDYFIKKIQVLDDKIILNGDTSNRLPNNINITIPNIPSDLLVIELSARGIYVSEKSACKAGEAGVSHVIKALRRSDLENSKRSDLGEMGSLRFSFGRSTTKSNIDYTLKSLAEILKKLKRWYN